MRLVTRARATAAAALCALIALPALAQQELPSAPPGVIMVVTLKKDGDRYTNAGGGTGFIISPDGHALTNSHVVYRAVHDPNTFVLIAVVGHEFYGARVLCASRLPYDPTHKDPRGVTLSRDIAEIQLAPPDDIPFRAWGIRAQGQFVTLATRHDGPMPAFEPLPLSTGPAPGRGTKVNVIGFGHISPIPYPWTSEGQVDESWETSDGTHVFSIDFQNPAQPGNSGSPVLGPDGRVVGVWTWYYLTRSNLGAAQAIGSVTPACR